MKTGLDMIDIVWTMLNASPLQSLITGGIFKHLRPAGGSKEDVVINSLSVTHEQLQNGIANVNIYVPNLVVNANGIQDDTQPNHSRLNELTKVAIGLLEENWMSDLNYDVQQHMLIREETGEHYMNIRLQFYIENL